MKLPKFLSRKENPTNKSVLAIYGGSSFIGTPKNYYSLAKAGYESCATAYSCVKLIANTASRIPWYVQRMDSKGNATEIENHPVVTLLNRPNEIENGARFTEKLISHLLLAGNSYVLRVSGTPSGPPRFMYALRPDRMEVNSDKTGKFLISSYTYNRGTGGPTFPADEVMHLMEFHPTHDFYGLSRIEVAAMQIDTMNAAAEWNAKLLQNDLKAPGIITSKSTYDLERIKSQFKENYQGSANAGLPIVLEGEDIKWETLSINPKDADWLKGQQFTLRQICSIFGVDPCLVGDAEYATYANKQEARKGLYLEVILPLMDLIRDEYQHWLFPEGSREQLMYDKDSIDELQEDRGKKYAYLATADWLTLNEKRVETGFDEIVGGDVILVPISNVPLEEATAPPEPMPDFTPGVNDEPDADAEDEPEPPPAKSARRAIKAVKKSFWTDPERKAKLWTNFETRVKTREKSFQQIARKYLDSQWEGVKAKLGKALTLDGLTPESLFDKHSETDRYVKDFRAWYRDHFIRAGNAGMRASKGELFNDAEFKAETPTSWVFHMTPAQEAKLTTHIFNTGSQVNDTTVQAIYDKLKEAQSTNMTVSEFSRAVWDEVKTFDPWRARLWAKNESVWTDSYGQNEAFKETEFVDMKGWLSAFLPTSREDHMAASDQEVGVNESFKIGRYMQEFPGDGSQGAPVEETIQCMCSIYPVVGPGTGE